MRSPKLWTRGLHSEQDELREVLARVSESEHRFREPADSAPVFIWTADSAGLIDGGGYARAWPGHHRRADGRRRGDPVGDRHYRAHAPHAGPPRGGVSTIADIDLERVDAWTVARVSGELDMTNTSYVRDQLTRSVPSDVDGLVTDLTGTLYLDSAAIELLFEMARRLGRRRQRLRIVLPPESPLGRVLELTDVKAVAPIHPTLAEALAAG